MMVCGDIMKRAHARFWMSEWSHLGGHVLTSSEHGFHGGHLDFGKDLLLLLEQFIHDGHAPHKSGAGAKPEQLFGESGNDHVESIPLVNSSVDHVLAVILDELSESVSPGFERLLFLGAVALGSLGQSRAL